ncbi:hypothetical protein MMC27_005915 [Xylographa pallens]|nr:hypothetical protein [Xylographa pallens]
MLEPGVFEYVSQGTTAFLTGRTAGLSGDPHTSMGDTTASLKYQATHTTHPESSYDCAFQTANYFLLPSRMAKMLAAALSLPLLLLLAHRYTSRPPFTPSTNFPPKSPLFTHAHPSSHSLSLSHTYSLTSTSTSTPAIPPAPHQCYTLTTTTTSPCRGFHTATCPTPDCVVQSTRTVPCGEAGCLSTGTETRAARCTRTCAETCGTLWATVVVGGCAA